MSNEAKVAKYQRGGMVLAEMSTTIGMDLLDTEKNEWAKLLGGFALYDDVTETDPHYFSSGRELARSLGFTPIRPLLESACANLLYASNAADTASTVKDHFDHRAEEAVACVDLIRYGFERTFVTPARLWNQITNVAIAGIHLDSVLDAHEDAQRLPQFTAPQLRREGAKRFARTTLSINPSTWRALLEASRAYRIDIDLGRKLFTSARAAVPKSTQPLA